MMGKLPVMSSSQRRDDEWTSAILSLTPSQETVHINFDNINLMHIKDNQQIWLPIHAQVCK